MVLSTGCGLIGDGSDLEAVVIGADLALTGEASELGTIYRNAIELRIEQVNEQGLLGDRELVLEDVRDNRSDPATSVTNISELAADQELAAIITGGCGVCAVSAAEVATEQGVPTIALAGPDAVSEPVEERGYAFKLGPNAGDTAAVLARDLADAGMGTLGLVTVDDQYGEDGQREMIAAAERNGMTVPVTGTIDVGGDGIDRATAAIVAYQPEPGLDQGQSQEPEGEQATGPDAVVIWAYPAQATALAVELRQAGYEGPLYLDTIAADRQFLVGQDGQALAGASMIFTKTLVIDEVIATSPAAAARKNWFSEYSARYGTYNAFSSFAADAVQVLVEAINRAGNTDRELLRSIVESTQLEGFTGTIRMHPGQHSGLLSQSLVRLVASGDRWRLGSSF
jgi:branched-chain amino acid transport system substrate-binding protein